MAQQDSPVTAWFHISMVGGDPWVLPIWTAVNKARDRGRKIEVSDALGDLALHVSVRLNMLPRAINRINTGFQVLYQVATGIDARYVSTAAKQGYAVDVDDKNKYELLLDIDSFLFELNSACELMRKFFVAVQELAGYPIEKDIVGTKLRDIIGSAGKDQDGDWYAKLDAHRNFFIHEGAPYAAVDMSRASEGKYDLLIMKENLMKFDDSKTFVRLSELDTIVRGFVGAKPAIQEHLIRLFDDGEVSVTL